MKTFSISTKNFKKLPTVLSFLKILKSILPNLKEKHQQRNWRQTNQTNQFLTTWALSFKLSQKEKKIIFFYCWRKNWYVLSLVVDGRRNRLHLNLLRKDYSHLRQYWERDRLYIQHKITRTTVLGIWATISNLPMWSVWQGPKPRWWTGFTLNSNWEGEARLSSTWGPAL